MIPTLILAGGVFVTLAFIIFAFAGASGGRAQSQRLMSMRERHLDPASVAKMEAQMRRVATNSQASQIDATMARLLPNPGQLRKRLSATGKNWTLGQYGLVTLGLIAGITLLLLLRGLPILLAVLVGLTIGAGLPHMLVGFFGKKRANLFNVKFPDAIELLVRGLRSGLPITETIGVVASEVPGPVGEEFRTISDKMKIGRTLEAALQESADRLGTAEFQFFCITISIQRETGGNLAETLGNLADVLRKRAQMKLKVKAMSSEAKASAYIVGALPFIVFGLIYAINSEYLGRFFIDPRLMIAGGGGLVWMGIGCMIMAKMVNFEI